ncbi:MAG: TonB-dependent receptor [Vicinamibacterales bacterium]
MGGRGQRPPARARRRRWRAVRRGWRSCVRPSRRHVRPTAVAGRRRHRHGGHGPHAGPVRPEVGRRGVGGFAARAAALAGRRAGRRRQQRARQHGDVDRRPAANGLRHLRVDGRRAFDALPRSGASRQPAQRGRRGRGVAASAIRLAAQRSDHRAGAFGPITFRRPHGNEQDEAGQDQRQRITQRAGSVAWQQAVGRSAIQVGGYARRVDARLLPSDDDTPLRASSTRRHNRQGLLASMNRRVGRHDLTAGGEAARLSLHEDFAFAVTDRDADDLSEVARAFTTQHPFVFSDQAARTQWSAFAQDRVRFGPLSLETGLRYDRTELLVPASQWSPRLGAGLELPGLAASMRLSFNRFFQPPQAEHLLLASSEAARALSPFATDDDRESGGAAIEPERTSAWELGWDQRLPAGLRLDVDAWHRRVKNYADPNVFFGTTIVFPNSVARGTARGLDVRLTLPSRRGWSGSASYTLSKVEQEGPINGGLFLEDDIDALGPGVTFTPDHDQRHVGAATISWVQPVGRWSASAQARYASGTPLEVGELDDADLANLLERPGADLIDVERGRVKPRLVVDVTASARLLRAGRAQLSLGASVLNAFNRRYAFNFGNPFSGTHFGAPRQFRVDLSASFR